MNFGVALSTFVGQNLGANKPERVRQGLQSTLNMSAALAVITTICVILFRRPLMGLFTKDVTVIELGAEYLVIVASAYLIFSTMFVVGGVMRGAGDTLIPMFITLLSLWLIRIPFTWFLSHHIGLTGIWWAIPISWSIGLGLSYIYYRKGNWRKKVVVRYKSGDEP